MKKEELFRLFRLFAMPAGLILTGAVLLIVPDYAAALAARLISYFLTAAGIFFGIAAVTASSGKRLGRILGAAFCLILGGVLLANPLILAANIGRVLGIVLALEGIQNLIRHSTGKPTAIFTLLAGAVLLLSPMTASRLVFRLCGLLLVVIGIVQLRDRLRRTKYLPGKNTSNIIDAED